MIIDWSGYDMYFSFARDWTTYGYVSGGGGGSGAGGSFLSKRERLILGIPTVRP